MINFILIRHSFYASSSKLKAMTYKNLLSIGFLLIVILSSCVSSRKYKDALSREQSLMDQNGQLSGNINGLNAKLTDAQNENSRLINQIDAAGKNAAELARLALKVMWPKSTPASGLPP